MSGISIFYFNNFNSSGEQQLLQSLVTESTGIYGQDMYYIPRVINNYDSLLQTDDQSIYNTPYQICIYIENINGFNGDGSFMSKFGVQIRDQVIFTVPVDTFAQVVGSYDQQVRPNEGDIIYFPLNKKCFQITYVDKFSMFYALGSLYQWRMYCEVFEYSNEIFDTGIPEIDSMQVTYSTNILDYSLMDELANPLIDEANNYLVVQSYVLNDVDSVADNDIFKTGSDGYTASGSNNFIDFSESNPFSEEA